MACFSAFLKHVTPHPNEIGAGYWRVSPRCYRKTCLVLGFMSTVTAGGTGLRLDWLVLGADCCMMASLAQMAA